MEQKPSNLVTLPGAIIIAGALIAMAVFWNKSPSSNGNAVPSPSLSNIEMPQIGDDEHILGNPNAKIKIVMYSDPSCPVCKMFNPVISSLMNKYGPSGKVALVYRSFPLDKPGTRPDGGILHPNAGKESQAFECVAALGGNDIFWKFENKFYTMTPGVTKETPDGLDQTKLPEIAKSVGIDPVSFNECLSSGRFKNKVEEQYAGGLKAGVTGVPYSVIVTPSGSKIPIIGYVDYATLEKAMEALLQDSQSSL